MSAKLTQAQIEHKNMVEKNNIYLKLISEATRMLHNN